MSVLKSRKFWYAVVGLILNLVAWLLPDIPNEVRAGMSTVLTALVAALIAGHTITDSAHQKRRGAESLASAIASAGESAKEAWRDPPKPPA